MLNSSYRFTKTQPHTYSHIPPRTYLHTLCHTSSPTLCTVTPIFCCFAHRSISLHQLRCTHADGRSEKRIWIVFNSILTGFEMKTMTLEQWHHNAWNQVWCKTVYKYCVLSLVSHDTTGELTRCSCDIFPLCCNWTSVERWLAHIGNANQRRSSRNCGKLLERVEWPDDFCCGNAGVTSSADAAVWTL